MKKHEILENIYVEKLIFWWNWLGHIEDWKKIIIKWSAIPGSYIDVRITKIKNTFIEAQVYAIRKKSPLEKDIPDSWQLYGGCKWLPIAYEDQLSIKEAQIAEAFHPLKDHTINTNFHAIIPSVESEHYRNKVEFSWGKYISAKEWIYDEYRFWFHLPGQFDRIEDCRYCVLADDEINSVFKEIDRIARASGLLTYDPKTQVGFWRHLVLRKSRHTGEIMIIFSLNATVDTEISQWTVSSYFKDIVNTLVEKFSHIVSVYIFENTGKADIVTGNAVNIYGTVSITDSLLGMQFNIQPKSFFQVNTLTAEKLYSEVIQSIKYKNETSILLDLYAWTGTIGILLSPYFKKVYSVELVASASEDGKNNARLNWRDNIDFINQKVEDFSKEFSITHSKADVIVIDPPRDGLHKDAIDNIRTFGAREIIYVSCNPATLVRDLDFLVDIYTITDVTPVDMFPHTHHIETVVRLEKKQ